MTGGRKTRVGREGAEMGKKKEEDVDRSTVIRRRGERERGS